jgi:hypothetical protein
MELGKLEMYIMESQPSLVIIYDFTIGKTTYVHLVDKDLEDNEIEIVPIDYVFKHLPGDWTVVNDGKIPVDRVTKEEVKNLNVKLFMHEDEE